MKRRHWHIDKYLQALYSHVVFCGFCANQFLLLPPARHPFQTELPPCHLCSMLELSIQYTIVRSHMTYHLSFRLTPQPPQPPTIFHPSSYFQWQEGHLADYSGPLLVINSHPLVYAAPIDCLARVVQTTFSAFFDGYVMSMRAGYRSAAKGRRAADWNVHTINLWWRPGDFLLEITG